tara:strand:+ start:11065 stop:11205 length:141 start_codon:yes stop_codon:yes gene_type:complete
MNEAMEQEFDIVWAEVGNDELDESVKRYAKAWFEAGWMASHKEGEE